MCESARYPWTAALRGQLASGEVASRSSRRPCQECSHILSGRRHAQRGRGPGDRVTGSQSSPGSGYWLSRFLVFRGTDVGRPSRLIIDHPEYRVFSALGERVLTVNGYRVTILIFSKRSSIGKKKSFL